MIGVDEVGRGAWAGPLLVVATRQVGQLPAGLNDSKQLTKKAREALIPEITQTCDIGEGWVEPSEVDTLGLTLAMKLAVRRALSELEAAEDEAIIIDGHINYCDVRYKNARCEIKADATYPVVSAASIYAKVTRDTFMSNTELEYPGYGFDRHVGYGTAAHRAALRLLGVTDIHRRSYKPVQVYL